MHSMYEMYTLNITVQNTSLHVWQKRYQNNYNLVPVFASLPIVFAKSWSLDIIYSEIKMEACKLKTL